MKNGGEKMAETMEEWYNILEEKLSKYKTEQEDVERLLTNLENDEKYYDNNLTEYIENKKKLTNQKEMIQKEIKHYQYYLDQRKIILD